MSGANPRVLRALRARLAGWRVLGLALLLPGILGGAAFALAVLDAALDLPEPWRVSAPWLLGAVAVLVLGTAFWRWRRLTEARLARFFERSDPSLGNRLINAVQLSASATAGPVEAWLRREAIELGRQSAAKVAAWPAARARVRLAAAVAGLAAVAWMALAWWPDDVLAAVLPRFLDPRGDHPPYSQLRISVTPGRTQVLYGGQIEVRATTSGRPADKLWLVARAGTNTTRALMFLAPDKSFFQTLVNLREPAEYFVTDGRARSRRHPIAIRYTPQITLAEAVVTFPEYTGKPPRSFKLGAEPQAFPEDTRLSLRVASNRPLKSGQLTLTPVLGGKAVQVTLLPEAQPNIVAGAFTLTQALALVVTVRDIDDLEGADPVQARFQVLPDERPRVFVLEPGRDAVATPSVRVPVRAQAEDDYGISRVMWLRSHNRSIERPFSMKLDLKNGARSVEAAGVFDFPKLGVKPGDVLEYYLEAADNYPKGPNLALSRLFRIEIISQEQYEQILRQAAARKALFEPYFQLGNWLRRLAERARNLEKQALTRDGSKATLSKDAQALADDVAKYEAELGKLLPQAMLFDVEQAFRHTLVEQHTRVERAAKEFQAALAGGQPGAKPLGALADELENLSQAEAREVGQPAGQIASVARVLARADVFVKLAARQAALARMLRRFADHPGELSRIEQMEMQELAHQQRRVQEGLRDLLASLPELLAQVPSEAQYDPLRKDVNEFIKAVNDAQIEADLAAGAERLSGLDGKAAAPLAQSAAEKMDRLIAKCDSLPGDAKTCLRFQPKVQQALGRTLEQILAAMGAGVDVGQGGRDGYGLFNDDVALFGSNIELAGEQAGGRQENTPGGARRNQRLTGDARDPGLQAPGAPGRVRLQPDARFPLRYRELVGEYFRAIAESETQTGGKP